MNKAICFVILISLSSLTVMAQDASSEADLAFAKKGKRIKIDFGDELVQGEVGTPDAMFLNTKKNHNFKKLIKIRENFNVEMDKSKNAFQK